MTTVSAYEEWEANRKKSSVGAADVVLGSQTEAPDQIASDLNLGDAFAQQTGRQAPTPSMVSQFRPIFQQQVERGKSKAILSRSPVLTEWLRNPTNAGLARDDLEGLSWYETIGKSTTNAIGRGIQRLPQSYNQFMSQEASRRAADQGLSYGGILEDQRGPNDGLIPDPEDLFMAGTRYLQSRMSSLFGSDQKAAAAYYQQRAGEISRNISSISMSPQAARFRDEIYAPSKNDATLELLGAVDPSADLVERARREASPTMIDQLSGFLSKIANDRHGFTAFLLETAVESTPGLAAATAATAVTRNPAAGAVALGGYSASAEAGLAPVELFAERGIDVSTPEGAMEVISNPELIQEAAKRGEVRGMIIGALDGLSGGIAGKTLAASPIGNVALQSITQAVMGASGEGVAQVASGQELNVVDVLVEGLAEFVTAPIEVAGIGGGAYLEGVRKSKSAEDRKSMFQELAGKSVASKTRERMPKAFRDFVMRATENGPVENVYVPADQFVEYFQGTGVDPFELADQLDGVSADDLHDAQATGGDLQIPTATYAASIAGSEHDAFLMENMRFDPDEFTSKEAAEFNAKAGDALEEAYQVAESMRQENERLQSFESQIYESMLTQLRRAGRSTEVATTEATLYPAFYRVMAERSGMTTDEFLALYPLPKVRGAVPEELKPKNVTALNRTLAEARARKAVGLDKRTSLLEFIDGMGGINDLGGELKSRDAEVIKRGKGKKSLKIAKPRGITGGMKSMFGGKAENNNGVDDVALSLIEAGYMANDPEVMAYKSAMASGAQTPDIAPALWRAIDRELSGVVEYSSADAPSTATDDSERLENVEEYLAGLGVSLDDEDAAIIAAIEADQSDGREYGQEGRDALVKEVQTLASTLKEELGLRDLSIYLSGNDDLKINMIAVPKGSLGEGRGSRAMQRIVDFADAKNLRTKLTTGVKDDGFGTTSRSRLIKFYKRFGFVENKGRNKDFSITENMYRLPAGRKYGQTLLGHGSYFFGELEQKNRGSIQFPGAGFTKGDTIISLFQEADLSTFLHESGHYFLTVIQDLAAKGEGQSLQDYEAVKSWWRSNADSVAKDAIRVVDAVNVTTDDVLLALDNGTTGDVIKDAAIDVGMQEQWARAFETYLLEGKAPSAELRTAFEKFRAWLISVYRNVSGLNVTISDELRGVFDRMLASEVEIKQAMIEAGDRGPLFANAEQMGMSDEGYAAFVRLYERGAEEGRAKMLAEVMAPVRREREKWFKEERKKVRENVERNVNAEPVYRAIEWMGNRRWLTGEQPSELGDVRLSKEILVDRYGEGVLKTLPRGKQAIYAVQGGLDPDDAAGLFGFSSGDQMIKALEQSNPRKTAIEAKTDLEMFERHGDVMKDGAIEAAALDAIHGDKRAQALGAELKALVDISGSDRGLTHKEARIMARETLARMRVRDAMNVNRFLTAERKAGEEATRLSATVTRTGMWADAARRRVARTAKAAVRTGDATAALTVNDVVTNANTQSIRQNENATKLVEAKRRQLLNHMLFDEARKVADEVGKAETLVAKLQKKSTREKLAGDYLSAIDDLLDRYDFRRLTGKAEDQRGALLAFIERMKADGRENELAIPDVVLADAKRTPYRTLSVEHLRGVVDSLKNIEHTARMKQKLVDAKSARELTKVVDEITAAFDANMPKQPPARVATKAETRGKKMREFLDLVLNAGTILREIDGFEDFGSAFKNLKTPIDEAMNRLQGRRRQAAIDLEALYEPYSKEERRRMAVREMVPELGYALSKWEKISVALNTGNDGNFQRLTDGKVRGSMSEAQVKAVLDSLDDRDAAFVQSVWDYLETFRSDIAAREKRATGVEPKWVEPRPTTIAGKALSGGYYPLRYDPRLSSLARDDQENDISKSLQAGRFGKAQTKNGHLQARAKSSGRDVELDISVMHKHVNQVIYDIELSEPVANSWRILQDTRIRNAFTNSGKQADFDALEIWLKDVAEGEVRSADWVGSSARKFKSNFTAAKLAFNLSTVAVQVTGLAQSMVVVGKKDFLKGALMMSRRGVTDEIADKSQFMSERQTTFNKDIYDLYEDPKLGPVASRWEELRGNIVAPLGLWLMTKVQYHAVDVPTWLAGYQQGLRRFGGDEAKAIANADDIVKRAQASGLFSDRSAIERGSVSRTARQNDVVRLFTTLGSYMFAKFNVAYERSAKAKHTILNEGVSPKSAQEALSWTLDMAFLFTLEAVMYAAIKGRLPDDEDEDDKWSTFLGRETALSVLSTIPFVRDISSVATGFGGGGAYGAITEEFAMPLVQAGQGEVDKAFVKSVINATGLMTGVPSTQINRVVDAGWRTAEGDDVSPAEYFLGRTGK